MRESISNACGCCGHTESAGTRFCTRCGTAIGAACCGFDNPPAARFCGGCGRAVSQRADTEDLPLSTGVDADEVLAEAVIEKSLREIRDEDEGPVHFDQTRLDELFFLRASLLP